MMTDSATPGYSHTQQAPFCLIFDASALACCGLAWTVGETPGVYVGGGVGLLFALLAPALHHLTVVDQGHVLPIRFGPVPLFRRTVRYFDIESVEVGRTIHEAENGRPVSRIAFGLGTRSLASCARVLGLSNGRTIQKRCRHRGAVS